MAQVVDISMWIQLLWFTLWVTIWGTKAYEYPYWTYSVTFAIDIELGIQIFWTMNCTAVSQWKIVRSVATIFFFLNNCSLGNGYLIHGSKDLNGTFNVGGKSNWVRPLRHCMMIIPFVSSLVPFGPYYICTTRCIKLSHPDGLLSIYTIISGILN